MNRAAGAILVLLGLALLPALGAAQEGVLLREEFTDLANWRPVTFPKIREHTHYTIEQQERESVLRAESRASASAIVYRSPFRVYDYPRLRWKWKVENVYAKGNARTREGDDYPLRIYVLFEYDPSTASAFDRAKYGLAKALYGEYPPHSALNYVWASREDEGGILTNPYASSAKMIVLQKGKRNLGRWIVEERNILDDYRMAFGTDPPARATLGIMSDSDNTGEASVAYVGFIEVFR
ncbi:MAG: DUF3047 domain-containing protein [Syntrophaceae bacterium]|nr:DUF3047 domain-containing protein [Syntrophaceae bacterium]